MTNPKPKGGRRPGSGRPPGPSKATLEKALIAERAVADARARALPLGREVLDKFMQIFSGMAAYYQPDLRSPASKPQGNEDKFEKYARLAIEAAKLLAPFQSPTMKAITIQPLLPEYPTAAPQAPGGVASKLSPQETYRLMRDAEVVDAAPARRRRADG